MRGVSTPRSQTNRHAFAKKSFCLIGVSQDIQRANAGSFTQMSSLYYLIDQASEDPDIYPHLSEAYLQHQIARKDKKNQTEDLWERAGQDPVAQKILRRKRGWIGHTLRKPVSNFTRQALTWNAQVKRKRGPDLATAGRETLKQSNREPTGVTRKPVTCYSNQILKQNSS